MYYAQLIQTGNANAQSTVQTDVQGSGSVSTHIEVNANGQTKTLDTNSPGTYKLEVGSDSNQTLSPTITISPPSISTHTPIIIKGRETFHKPYSFQNFMTYIQDFFEEILTIFKK